MAGSKLQGSGGIITDSAMIEKERQALEKIKLKQVILMFIIISFLVKRNWTNDGIWEENARNQGEKWGKDAQGVRKRRAPLTGVIH